ncbi:MULTISPECIES: hypothetical protein [unclassified Pseudoalteromonas]|uniref:hypothetical protein n=1 Tax=unclassified Pseudoalteromonas TaxID=194690 RepID=UPI000C07B08D|nr:MULTISPECIES: hypothetical protein [unclassified Pseudoalteromonas]MDP2636686.1 hypothetical protein [Pseudoalteromonas sp. 1_MG-2023]PHN88283.1 hypothetical protein CSC79_18720 [Pseudoalteromonas sp. 3D05]
MYVSKFNALDAAITASEKADSNKSTCDERATVIDLLSQSNKLKKSLKEHETDQIFILGYN